MALDRKAAWLRGVDYFPRFVAERAPTPLHELNMDDESLLLVWTFQDEPRAALVRQMNYHHVLQGEHGGEPFVVSFCMVCHAGVGLHPRVDGETLNFSCGGIYQGQSLLIDDESESYWDPLSGECLLGEKEGARLKQFSVELMTCHDALAAHPNLLCHVADRGFAKAVFGRFGMFRMGGKGFLPPGFKGIMAGTDVRRPRMEKGLGVVVRKKARWYSQDAIRAGAIDSWGPQELKLSVQSAGYPAAEWDDGSRPLQFQCRWYSFASSYPDCQVHASSNMA